MIASTLLAAVGLLNAACALSCLLRARRQCGRARMGSVAWAAALGAMAVLSVWLALHRPGAPPPIDREPPPMDGHDWPVTRPYTGDTGLRARRDPPIDPEIRAMMDRAEEARVRARWRAIADRIEARRRRPLEAWLNGSKPDTGETLWI